MRLLKDKDTFSMNRQYIAYEDWGFYPTYYAMIDHALLKAVFEAHVKPNMINNDKCSISKYFFVLSRPLPPSGHWLNQWVGREKEINAMILPRLQNQLSKDKIQF